jgi:hypothetical protein
MERPHASVDADETTDDTRPVCIPLPVMATKVTKIYATENRENTGVIKATTSL